MKLTYKVSLILILTLATGCASGTKGAKITADPIDAILSDTTGSVVLKEPVDRSVSYYRYLLGLREEGKGEYKSAVENYLLAIDHDETLLQAYNRATTLLVRTGKISKATEVAKRGLSVDKNYTPLLIALGGIYSAINEAEKAIVFFKRIVRLTPEIKEAWIYLAVSHYQMGNHKEALETLGIYNKKFPGDPLGLYYLGRVYASMKNWKGAEDVFLGLMKNYPTFPRAYDGLAATYIAQKKIDEAVKIFEAYMKIDSGNEEMKSKLAETYLLQKSYDKAIGQLEDLAGDEPYDLNLQFKLGVTYWRQAEIIGDDERYKKALGYFQMVLSQDSNNLQAVYYVAIIFERLKLFDEAIESWKKLLDDSDEAFKTYMKISDLYEKAGNTNEALNFAIMASDVKPEDSEIYYFIGLLQNKLKDDQKALEAFLEAAKINENEEKYHFYIGVSYEKLNEKEKCIASMKKVLDLNPEHQNALNYLGYLYAEQGVNLDYAEQLLLKALKQSPENGYFLDSLGWIYYKQKKYKKALQNLLAATRRIPPDPVVLEHLGDVYSAMENKTEAIEAYEKSLEAESEDETHVNRSRVRKKLNDLQKIIPVAISGAN